jgi:hypothetical protein
MAKHRYAMDEEKIARFLKEGRGQGGGADYKPFLTIHDVPSNGLSSRIPGRKTGRLHHTLSKIERALILIYDWDDDVSDLREQFPLDREVTRQIAASMGVKHPQDPKTGVDIVMTTDVVVSYGKDAAKRLLPRAAKTTKELNDSARVVEKLEIESRYWEIQGAPWALITEREIPAVRVGNLEWLAEMRSLEHLVTPHPDYWRDRCQQFIHALTRTQGASMQWLCEQLQNEYGFDVGEPLTALRHLASNKRVVYDLDRPFDIKASAGVFRVADDEDADAVNLRRAA